LEVFKKEYPELWEAHGFPLHYLDEIWAREYHVAPSMIHYDFELERIKTQVDARVRLKYDQIRAKEREREKQEGERAKELSSLKIKNASFEELVEGALECLEQNLANMENVESRYQVDSLLRKKYDYYNLDATACAKLRKVEDEVYKKWLEKRWLDSEEYKRLSQVQKQKLEEFKNTRAQKLADDLLRFFLKHHKSLIFNHNLTYLKPVFEKFWSNNYPFLDNLWKYTYGWTYHDKRREAEELTLRKLREVEKEEYARILKFVLDWASHQNKAHIERPEIKAILISLSYRGAPQRIVYELYVEANARLS
jgi:hypothetical protein